MRPERRHMDLTDVYFIKGTAYAGKSTTVIRLAEKHNGIACRENYHEELMDEMLDPEEFPCLCYTRDLKDWHDFVRRTPDEYEAWVDGAAAECEKLELKILDRITGKGKPVFVDTNISLETLGRITDRNHVLVMLADPEISVRRFFERPDREKQFLYRLMKEEPDPEKSLENFRECLKRINSPERYERFLHSGYPVILRDENRTIEETVALAEKVFGLEGKNRPPVTVRKIDPDTPMYERLIRFVESCSWDDARDHIAQMLRNRELTDWETMFAAVSDGNIVGMASVMKTDYYPIPEVFPWVSCIFVTEKFRGRRISGELIACANRYLKQLGFARSYIPSGFSGLYEHYGYEYLRDIVNYGGGTDRLYAKDLIDV